MRKKFFLGGIVFFLIVGSCLWIVFDGRDKVEEVSIESAKSFQIENKPEIEEQKENSEIKSSEEVKTEEFENKEIKSHEEKTINPPVEKNVEEKPTINPVIPKQEPESKPEVKPTPTPEPAPQKEDNQDYLNELAKVEYTNYQVCMDKGFQVAFSDTVNILGFSCRDVYWQGQVIGYYLKLDYTNPMEE